MMMKMTSRFGGARLIAGELVPVAVVAGEDGGTLENHGAIAFYSNAGVAVGHNSIAFDCTVMRVVVSHEVTTGDALGTTLTKSVSGHGGIALTVSTQTAISSVRAILALSAGLVPRCSVFAEWPSHLSSAMPGGLDDVNGTRYAGYGRWFAQAGCVVDVGFLDIQPATGVGGGDGIVLDYWETTALQVRYEQRREPVHVSG